MNTSLESVLSVLSSLSLPLVIQFGTSSAYIVSVIAGTRPALVTTALRSHTHRSVQQLPVPLLSLQAAYDIADDIFEHARWWWFNINIRVHILLAGGHPRTLVEHLIDLKKHPDRCLYPIYSDPLDQSPNVLAHLLLGRLGKFTCTEKTMLIDRGYLAPMQQRGAFLVMLRT